MSKRKNLNDALFGDRADVRGYKLPKIFDDEDSFGKDYGMSPKYPVKAASHDGSSGGTLHKFGGGERCYHSHAALTLPGTKLKIYGGSCIDPAVKDADVYIGFDSGMKMTRRHWPWEDGTEILFKITDMAAPEDPVAFRKLVEWVRGELVAGRKIHCGCIGGHGRTGTFLAALVSTYGEKDAIGYVRKNYCKKAVESSSQTKFLVQHYGVSEATGTKSGGHGSSQGGKAHSHKPGRETVTPIKGNGCIWEARR